MHERRLFGMEAMRRLPSDSRCRRCFVRRRPAAAAAAGRPKTAAGRRKTAADRRTATAADRPIRRSSGRPSVAVGGRPSARRAVAVVAAVAGVCYGRRFFEDGRINIGGVESGQTAASATTFRGILDRSCGRRYENRR
jgi:hypothetical protein